MARPAPAAVLAGLGHVVHLRGRPARVRRATPSRPPTCCPPRTRCPAHEPASRPAPGRRLPVLAAGAGAVLAAARRALAALHDEQRQRTWPARTTRPGTAASPSSRPTSARPPATLRGTTVDGAPGRPRELPRQRRRPQRLGLVVRALPEGGARAAGGVPGPRAQGREVPRHQHPRGREPGERRRPSSAPTASPTRACSTRPSTCWRCAAWSRRTPSRPPSSSTRRAAIAARISGATTKDTLVDLVDDVLSGRAAP